MRIEATDIIEAIRKCIDKIPKELAKNLKIDIDKAKKEFNNFAISISVEAFDNPNDYCRISNFEDENDNYNDFGFTDKLIDEFKNNNEDNNEEYEDEDEVEVGLDYSEDQLMSENDVKKYFKKNKQEKENKNKEEKSIVSENFNVIEKILKVCNQTDMNIIEKWTPKIEKDIKLILKNNNFDNENIIDFLKIYYINILKINDVKRFLQLLKYAFDKKQIIFNKK